MAELHITPSVPTSARALPEDTWLVLDQHPDKPRFRLSTDPIDDFLILELMLARKKEVPFDDQIELVMDLLAAAFAPGEWDRYRKALREVPTVILQEDGTRVPMNKQAIIDATYREIFPLYADRPTQPLDS